MPIGKPVRVGRRAFASDSGDRCRTKASPAPDPPARLQAGPRRGASTAAGLVGAHGQNLKPAIPYASFTTTRRLAPWCRNLAARQLGSPGCLPGPKPGPGLGPSQAASRLSGSLKRAALSCPCQAPWTLVRLPSRRACSAPLGLTGISLVSFLTGPTGPRSPAPESSLPCPALWSGQRRHHAAEARSPALVQDQGL
jgi:hypothetical protein